jgi:hypothetical protein
VRGTHDEEVQSTETRETTRHCLTYYISLTQAGHCSRSLLLANTSTHSVLRSKGIYNNDTDPCCHVVIDRLPAHPQLPLYASSSHASHTYMHPTLWTQTVNVQLGVLVHSCQHSTGVVALRDGWLGRLHPVGSKGCTQQDGHICSCQTQQRSQAP